MPRIVPLLKIIAEKDNPLGHLLRLVYGILSTEVARDIFNFAFAVVILPLALTTVKISSGDSLLAKLWQSHAVMAYISVFILGELLFSAAHWYKTRYLVTFKGYKSFVRSLRKCLAGWNKKTARLNKDLLQRTSLHTFKELYPRYHDYDERAYFLCQLIYDLLHETFSIQDHQVSIMHKARLSNNGSQFVRMIAFKNEGDLRPGSFGEKYFLDRQPDNRYYHAKVFIEGRTGVRALVGNQEITKHFVFVPKSEDREKLLQQYVAIPVVDIDDDIVSLIQFDSLTLNAFGRTKSDVCQFAETIIRPLGDILKLRYHKYQFAKLVQRL